MSEQDFQIARNLYSLFSSLSQEAQEAFLSELMKNKRDELEDFAFYLVCKEAKDENDWVSVEEVKKALDS